jgi:hypothetical protein
LSNYEFEFEGAPTPAFREELIKLAGREWDERGSRWSGPPGKRTTLYIWHDVPDDLSPPMIDRLPMSKEFEDRHNIHVLGVFSAIDDKERLKFRRRQIDDCRLKGDSELWAILEKADANDTVCAAADVLIERARK